MGKGEKNRLAVWMGRALWLGGAAALTGVAVMFPEIAHASVGLGKIAANATSQMQDIGTAVSGGSYLGAAVSGALAMKKFKDHTSDPKQHTIYAALGLLVLCGGLCLLPSMMETAGEGEERQVVGSEI